jgi:cytochrome b561
VHGLKFLRRERSSGAATRDCARTAALAWSRCAQPGSDKLRFQMSPTLEAATSTASPRYGAVAISLHWLLALAIIGSFSLGVYMHDLPFSIARVKLFNYHKWAGITILALSVLRLLWRLTHRPPPLSPRQMALTPAWQQRAAKVSHTLMYVLFLAVPLLGWAYSSAAGVPVVWFGVLPLPDWMPVNRDLANSLLKPLHAYAAFTLAGVVLLHVAAAIKHQFVDRDRLMSRMWYTQREELP